MLYILKKMCTLINQFVKPLCIIIIALVRTQFALNSTYNHLPEEMKAEKNTRNIYKQTKRLPAQKAYYHTDDFKKK